MQKAVYNAGKNDFVVSYPDDMHEEEMLVLVADEVKEWQFNNPDKNIARIELTPIGAEELDVKVVEKSPIKRVRRITGYLSKMENFNEAKQDELSQRLPHRCGCD